jgi:hypothetical protein
MNMTQVPGIPWSAGEAAAVNEFLSTNVGKKWLGTLFNLKPKVDLSSTEKCALTGAFAAGYEHFFDEISATRITHASESSSMRSIDPTKD